MGHQKRIRKLVRLISYPSAVHVAVWEECYWRWRALSEIPFDGVNDNADVAESSRPLVWQEVRFVQSLNSLRQSLNIRLVRRMIVFIGKILRYF